MTKMEGEEGPNRKLAPRPSLQKWSVARESFFFVRPTHVTSAGSHGQLERGHDKTYRSSYSQQQKRDPIHFVATTTVYLDD